MTTSFTSMGKELLKDGAHFADFLSHSDATLAAEMFNASTESALVRRAISNTIHRLSTKSAERSLRDGDAAVGGGAAQEH